MSAIRSPYSTKANVFVVRSLRRLEGYYYIWKGHIED